MKYAIRYKIHHIFIHDIQCNGTDCVASSQQSLLSMLLQLITHNNNDHNNTTNTVINKIQS